MRPAASHQEPTLSDLDEVLINMGTDKVGRAFLGLLSEILWHTGGITAKQMRTKWSLVSGQAFKNSHKFHRKKKNLITHQSSAKSTNLFSECSAVRAPHSSETSSINKQQPSHNLCEPNTLLNPF